MPPALSDIETRRAHGRSLRDQCPRSDHARWKLQKKRDLVPLLRETEAGRIPALLAEKYRRMSASPFSFYRGTANILAEDLATHHPKSNIDAQICGDAHLSNLGCYAATDGTLVFDLNDFDETIYGPFEWDLKRLTISMVLAACASQETRTAAHHVASECIASYRRTIHDISEIPFIEIPRYHVRGISDDPAVIETLRKAEHTTPEQNLTHLTVTLATRSQSSRKTSQALPRFRQQAPVTTAISARTRAALDSAIRDYRKTLPPQSQVIFNRYVPVDYAFKVVGTGSVGLRDYVVLMFGSSLGDPLFLQIKQAVPSVYARHLHTTHPAWQHQGHRVVEGTQLMQTATDPLLGWTSMEGREFYVRQFKDHKASLDPAELAGEKLIHLARIAGAVAARAHSRTADAAVIDGYCGDNDKLDRAMARFALDYAEQVTVDHRQFLALLRAKKLKSAKAAA